MTDLLQLAERVERATGADRELDALIVTTLCPGATVAEYIRGCGDDIVFHAQALGIHDKDCCPWYTASLDAAMALVPEGARFARHINSKCSVVIPRPVNCVPGIANSRISARIKSLLINGFSDETPMNLARLRRIEALTIAVLMAASTVAWVWSMVG